MLETIANNQKLIDVLMHGGLAVIRTDTLYGIVARADDERAVEKVYEAKKRDRSKSCIILIDQARAAYDHGEHLQVTASKHSRGATSFLVDAPSAPQWLRRANDELAYRVPAVPEIRELLARTGPLIAPSANTEGLPPARTIEEAKSYFGSLVDIYVDGGEVPADMPPSTLIKVHHDGHEERLR